MAPNYRAIARQAARRYGIDPELFVRQIQQESGFRPRVTSSAGAQGIAQIMPATARGWGVDPNDPIAALDAAAKNMARYVRQYGSYRNALIAYNAGPGRVGKPLYAETANYIQRIMGGRGEPARGKKGKGKSLGLGPELPGLPAAEPESPFAGRIAGLQSARDRLAPAKDERQQDSSERLGIGEDEVAGFWNAAPPPAQSKPTDLRGRTNELRSARQSLHSARQPAPVPDLLGGGDAHAGHDHGGGGPSAAGLNDYKDLLRIGSRFGLRIDGSNQTTGGNHTAGSLHYAGRAVDFGDAKNSPEKLRRLAAWARKNAPRIKELYYAPLGWHIKNGKILKGEGAPGHHDHLHIAI